MKNNLIKDPAQLIKPNVQKKKKDAIAFQLISYKI